MNYAWIDQYGQVFYADTLKTLRVKVGGGRVSKMYVEKKDGTSTHIGYVVGKHWCERFAPCRFAE